MDFDGICYELLGSAYEKYKKLDAQRAIAILKFQYEAIEPPNALIPISFSGTEDGIKEFSSKYNIEITENNQIGDKLNNENKIDKFIVYGIVSCCICTICSRYCYHCHSFLETKDRRESKYSSMI